MQTVDLPLTLLKALLVFAAAPTFALLYLRSRLAPSWALSPEGVEDGEGGYRHGSLEQQARRAGSPPPVSPPRLVALTVWLSFALGQMALPGLAGAIVGLVMLPPSGLLAAPGLVLALAQFGPAAALYRRDPGAPPRLLRLAKATGILNLVVTLVALGVMATGGREGRVIGGLTLAYAALSFTHAALLTRSARALEASLASHPGGAPGWPAEAPAGLAPFARRPRVMFFYAYHDGQQAHVSEEDLSPNQGDRTRLVLPFDREDIREAHRRVEAADPLALSSEAHGARELAQGRARGGSRARERARRPYDGGGRRVAPRPRRAPPTEQRGSPRVSP